MGRGTRNTSEAHNGATMRGATGGLNARANAAAEQIAMATVIESTHDENMVGRMIEIDMVNGSPLLLPIDGDAPSNLLEGLANAKSVDAQGNNRFLVRFDDGTSALVDLSDENNPQISFSAGDQYTQAQVHGALAMALARKHHFNDSDPDLARLADAYAARQELAGKPDPDVLKNFALAADAVLQGKDGELTINPTSMNGWADAQRRGEDAAEKAMSLSPRAMMRRRARRFGEVVHEAMGRGLSFNDGLRLAMFGTDDEGKVLAPSAAQIEAYNQAAVDLGGELIPELGEDNQPTGNMTNTLVPRVPNWHMGDQERLMLINMSHHAAIGTRTFFIAGPPGTGKTLLAKKWAELHGMPFSEFTLGEGVSMQALIGDTGMKQELIRNEQGDVVGAVPVTSEQEGKLLRVFKKPGVSCLNEAEDIAEQMLALNTAAGDAVGRTDGRTINTNTAEGKEISHTVDPDHYIFVTWNPGHDDKAPANSTAERGLTLHMKRGTPEEEAPKYAQMIEDALGFQNEEPALRNLKFERVAGTDDEGRPLPLTCPDVEPITRFAQQLQNAYNNDPATFRREVGPRVMAKFAASLLMEGAKNADDNPIETAMLQLRGLLPGYPAMGDDEAWGMLRQQVADEYQALVKFAKTGFDTAAGTGN